jgi:hypothetical protein
MSIFGNFENLYRLFGEHYDSTIVQEFLSQAPPHKIQKPSDGSQYVVCKQGGFDLLFEDLNAGGRGNKQDRRLGAIFFYNSGSDKHERYIGSFPYEFTFDDMRTGLIKKCQPFRSGVIGEGEVPVTFPFPSMDIWKVGEFELSAHYYSDTHEIHRFQLQPMEA